MTDTGPTVATARRWPRWKGVLLVVSLALNLLVIGLVSAAGIRHGWHPPRGASQATMLSFARTLPSERKREIWDAVRSERRALRPYWRELRQARADVRAALIADPFDVARYKAAHEQLLGVEIKVRRAAQSLYENVAVRLTAEERRGFAEWQARAERPWRRRGHKRPDAEDDSSDDGQAPKVPTTEPEKSSRVPAK
ncbi:MAG: periplasmic heavy metal sensor [Hyphomicrobiaceae bacterium]